MECEDEELRGSWLFSATTSQVIELINLRSFQIPLLQFLTFSELN